ncbi:MAG TPA: hypothetical protein VLM38_16545 [Blastocatellia bacterium]|nr:hypothetical protein [Blastocatellia bacterium]
MKSDQDKENDTMIENRIDIYGGIQLPRACFSSREGGGPGGGSAGGGKKPGGKKGGPKKAGAKKATKKKR